MLVTKKWSGRTNDGMEAEDVYQVSGVTNLVSARLAPGIPQLNSPYPDDYKLKALRPQGIVAGFGLYEIRVRFAIPVNGVHQDQSAIDPLIRNAQYEWLIGSSSEPIELAPDDNGVFNIPILNAAGDPVQPTPVEEFPTAGIRAVKTIIDFDAPTALLYHNSVNTDAFQILGRWNIDVGQARVAGFRPLGLYDITSTQFECELILDFRHDGFDYRAMNAGITGWYSHTGPSSEGSVTTKRRGRFDSDGPVRLDAKGKPYTTGTKIIQPGTDNVLVDPVDAPKTFAPLVIDTTYSTYLKYRTKRKLPFAPLLQLFS
jgi:hypothetical protein